MIKLMREFKKKMQNNRIKKFRLRFLLLDAIDSLKEEGFS